MGYRGQGTYHGAAAVRWARLMMMMMMVMLTLLACTMRVVANNTQLQRPPPAAVAQSGSPETCPIRTFVQPTALTVPHSEPLVDAANMNAVMPGGIVGGRYQLTSLIRELGHTQVHAMLYDSDREQEQLLTGNGSGSLPLQCENDSPPTTDVDVDVSHQQPEGCTSDSGASKYKLRKEFARGRFGEVWRAVLACPSEAQPEDMPGGPYILKRMFVEHGPAVRLSGLREIYFGELLRNLSHVARLIEHFNQTVCSLEPTPTCVTDLWLVFVDEGLSLQRYLYTTDGSEGSVVTVQRSEFWSRMRTEAAGQEVMKELLRQLLEGVAQIHSRGVVHRDLKPDNLLLDLGHHAQLASAGTLKIADFGSAIDQHALAHLYGSAGPSTDEETTQYQPPERILGVGPTGVPLSYDLWSVGVIGLEMFMGTADVFEPSARARILVENANRAQPPEVLETAYQLAGLAEYCIYPPQPATGMGDAPGALLFWPAPCGFAEFNHTVIRRDPLGIGFANPFGTKLLWRLLQWDASRRISAEEALQHAYFQGAYVCNVCGAELELPSELVAHVHSVHGGGAHHHKHHHHHQGSHKPPASPIVSHQFALPSDNGGLLEPNYTCPVCQRTFALWHSCDQHVKARQGRHGRFCAYDSQYLPPCEMLEFPRPLARQVGWCGVRGRRPYMEDVHYHALGETRELEHSIIVGVFDGHWGREAASFVAHELPKQIRRFATRVDLPDAMRMAFVATDLNLEEEVPGSRSGTTATVIVAPHDGLGPWAHTLVVGHVGDSRAVLCCAVNSTNLAVPLTADHTASLDRERERVLAAGGLLAFDGIWRVQGQLAVTRAIGDFHLRPSITPQPDVHVIPLESISPQFVIAGTDGLWDEVSNEDAVHLVLRALDQAPPGFLPLDYASRVLAHEAYVRGSSDNIGVSIIDLTACCTKHLRA